MQMIVDAALITKKSASLDYNTDSVNAAGKLWPREIVHSESGIKAAGKSQGKPYYVLASANAKGTAESAADLFKNCVSSFLPDGSNYSESIADFFRAFAQVLNKSGYEAGACDLAVFAGYKDRVYLAKSGKARLFRYSEDDFFEAKPQLFPHDDSTANYGVSVYSETKPGDIFVLLSGKVGAYISESLIKAIIRNSNGDIKRIVALIASNAVKNGCDEAVSAIVLKVAADETGAPVKAAVPAAFETEAAQTGAEEAVTAEAEAEPDPDAASGDAEEKDYFGVKKKYYVPTEEDIDEETESTEKINRYKSRNKFSRVAVIDVCIVIAVIAVLLGVLAVKGVFGSKSGKSTKDGVNVSDLFTEAETTTKKKNDKETTEAATKDETTTGRSDSNTTTRSFTPSTTQRSQTTPTTSTPIVTPTTRTPIVTEAPVTTPTTNTPPVTETPATEPPATEPPATEPPATDPPVTRDPNIDDDD